MSRTHRIFLVTASIQGIIQLIAANIRTDAFINCNIKQYRLIWYTSASYSGCSEKQKSITGWMQECSPTSAVLLYSGILHWNRVQYKKHNNWQQFICGQDPVIKQTFSSIHLVPRIDGSILTVRVKPLSGILYTHSWIGHHTTNNNV